MKRLILTLAVILALCVPAHAAEKFTLYFGLEMQTDAEGDYYTLAGNRVNASRVIKRTEIGIYDVIVYITNRPAHVLEVVGTTGYLGAGITEIATRALNGYGSGGFNATQLTTAVNNLAMVTYRDAQGDIQLNAGTVQQYIDAGLPGDLILIRPPLEVYGAEVSD